MVHVLHGVYFNFLVLSLTRCRPQLSHVVVGTLNQTTCNVNSPNTFETLIHKNVTDIAFSIVPNIYFFGSIKALDSKQSMCQMVQLLH